MAAYGEYTDPYELENRGIKRLSVVYGIVPIHEDGQIFRECGWPNQFDEWAPPEAPHKTAKGIVVRTDKPHEIKFFRDIKVSWQPRAIGRTSIARGTTRWPSTAELFSVDEVVHTVASATSNQDHHRQIATADLLQLDMEDAADQLDVLIEQPMGNTLITAILARAYEKRADHAFNVSSRIRALTPEL